MAVSEDCNNVKKYKYTIFVCFKKTKNGYKSCFIKGIVFVVHVTLVKPNVMQKLDEMNIIIQLKFQNR